jgi:hypothetical protein
MFDYILYIALALIASGMLIVIYSVSSSAKGRAGKKDHGSGPLSDNIYGQGQGGVIPTDDGTMMSGGMGGVSKDSGSLENIVKESMESVMDGADGAIPAKPEIAKAEAGRAKKRQEDGKTPGDDAVVMDAVLYEDSSGVIDYHNDNNTIDPTFEGYKKIRRIGRGRFEIGKDGINFYTGKKFFRFDFHRVRDIKTGSRFIALMLIGSEAVKLFIFDGETPAQSLLKRSYQSYSGRTV